MSLNFAVWWTVCGTKLSEDFLDENCDHNKKEFSTVVVKRKHRHVSLLLEEDTGVSSMCFELGITLSAFLYWSFTCPYHFSSPANNDECVGRRTDKGLCLIHSSVSVQEDASDVIRDE